MEKLKLKDGKPYLLRWNKPNDVRHKTYCVGIYYEEIECFNLNPTIHFKHIDLCLEVESIKDLQHFKDSTVGLWATDKPELIEDKNNIMFRIS